MSQMNVVRCSGCHVYQVEMQKKAKKWKCKMCGAKQSIMQVFYQGTSKQCRLQVQHLNYQKADLENEPQYSSGFTSHSDNSDLSRQFHSSEYQLNSLKRTFADSMISENEESEEYGTKRFKTDVPVTEYFNDSFDNYTYQDISNSQVTEDYRTDSTQSTFHQQQSQVMQSQMTDDLSNSENSVAFQTDNPKLESQISEDLSDSRNSTISLKKYTFPESQITEDSSDSLNTAVSLKNNTISESQITEDLSDPSPKESIFSTILDDSDTEELILTASSAESLKENQDPKWSKSVKESGTSTSSLSDTIIYQDSNLMTQDESSITDSEKSQNIFVNSITNSNIMRIRESCKEILNSLFENDSEIDLSLDF